MTDEAATEVVDEEVQTAAPPVPDTNPSEDDVGALPTTETSPDDGLDELFGKGDDNKTPAMPPIEDVEDEETEQVDEESVPAVEAEEGGEPEFDDALLARAKESGFSVDDFPTSDAMRRALVALDRRFVEMGKPQAPAEIPPQLRPQATRPEPSTAPMATPSIEDVPTFEPKWDDAETDEVDPQIRSNLDGLNKHSQNLFKEVQTAHQIIGQQLADVIGIVLATKVDAAIASLGEDYAGYFGKGSTDDLLPGSEEHGHRLQVSIDTGQLRSAYQNNDGIKMPSVFETMRRAAMTAAMGQDGLKNNNQAAGDKIAKTLKKRRGQSSTPPSRRRARKEPVGDPTQNTIAEVEKRWREKGITRG